MGASDVVGYLKGRIRSYENDMSKLRAQMDALEAEVNRLEALLGSAKLLLKDELKGTGGPGVVEGSGTPLSDRLAVLSLSEAIVEIVKSSQGPIHADQVLKRLREAGRAPRAKNPKNSVASLLHRGVKTGLYRKVGPNLFARIEGRDEAE